VAAVLAVCCVCCEPCWLLCWGGGGVPCGGKHIIIIVNPNLATVRIEYSGQGGLLQPHTFSILCYVYTYIHTYI